MPTECSPTLFEFAPVEGRAVVAGFDGGAITSDAGALLLGATDRVISLVGGARPQHVQSAGRCYATVPERLHQERPALSGRTLVRRAG